MKRFSPILLMVVACWVIYFVDHLLLNGWMTLHGIHPRRPESLPGILWSPFLHMSIGHLAANTLPLLILGVIISARSASEFVGVTLGGIVIGGGLTWFFARSGDHVGASGLIFCYFGFLTSRAWFDRTIFTLCVAAISMVGYGGMLIGMLPTSSKISWEGHVAGLLAGIACAWFITNKRHYEASTAAPEMDKV